MAERNNERARDDEKRNVNAEGGRKGANMEANLQQMMGQVEAPADDVEVKEYDSFSDWIEGTIKDPQPPTMKELELLKAQFEAARPDMPYDLEPANALIDEFFGKAENLLKEGNLESLKAEITSLASRLDMLMLKGEVDLLAMLQDYEKMEGL